jgi:MOSC domain-containing protein YiiM
MSRAAELESLLAEIPSSPTGAGTVERLVLRPEQGVRETPETLEFTPEEGVVGDTWRPGTEYGTDNQVSLINVHVARAIAGDDDRMPLSGDNLLVDLDLAEAALPVGTRLRAGSALLEVTPQPHLPCESFAARYGLDATRLVGAGVKAGLRSRGVLCRVLEAGAVSVGDRIAVEPA